MRVRARPRLLAQTPGRPYRASDRSGFGRVRVGRGRLDALATPPLVADQIIRHYDIEQPFGYRRYVLGGCHHTLGISYQAAKYYAKERYLSSRSTRTRLHSAQARIIHSLLSYRLDRWRGFCAGRAVATKEQEETQKDNRTA